MAKSSVPLRQRLSKNLRALASRDKLSGHQIAAKARLDPKTVNNMLRASHDPRLTHVEKVAKAFSMEAWELLAFDMAEKPANSAEVVALLECYRGAEDDGRQTIMRVAEIAAQKAK